MGVGAGPYMYDVVVKKFTFAISSPDEFLSSILTRGRSSDRPIDHINRYSSLSFVYPSSTMPLRMTALEVHFSHSRSRRSSGFPPRESRKSMGPSLMSRSCLGLKALPALRPVHMRVHLYTRTYGPYGAVHMGVKNAPVYTGRKYGPYLRAVFTNSAYRPLGDTLSTMNGITHIVFVGHLACMWCQPHSSRSLCLWLFSVFLLDRSFMPNYNENVIRYNKTGDLWHAVI